MREAQPVELDEWRTVDVADWPTYAPNVTGRRLKFWLQDPDGRQWLLKQPLPSRPTEPAIEAFTARLARAVGLEAPETHVATRDGVGWTLVLKFLHGDEELAHGNQLLQELDEAYDPEAHEGHRLELVRATLEAHDIAVSEFVAMLAFDAWVGNSDRHQENWGIVKSSTRVRLAPLYDTAACLGAELQDPRLDRTLTLPTERSKYVLNCPSGFGDGTRLIRLSEVVTELNGWPEWRSNARDWVDRFYAALAPARSYLESVPEVWWPRRRRDFAATMLWRRLIWLKNSLR